MVENIKHSRHPTAVLFKSVSSNAVSPHNRFQTNRPVFHFINVTVIESHANSNATPQRPQNNEILYQWIVYLIEALINEMPLSVILRLSGDNVV